MSSSPPHAPQNESSQPTPLNKTELQSVFVESAVRIGLIVILVLSCFAIVKPFIALIIWGGILAVAFYPVTTKMTAALNGRQMLAATLFTTALLAALIIPTAILATSSIEQAVDTFEELDEGSFEVPPPPPSIADLPIVGKRIHSLWSISSSNLKAAIVKYKSELGAIAKFLISSIGSTLGGLLQFAFSIIVAGVILARANACSQSMSRIAKRLFGNAGDDFIHLATGTIRSVSQGVVGIAIIQAFLASIGLFAVGVPGAQIWTLLVLLLAIVQLPPTIVLLPIILYVFSVEESTTVSVIFAIWSLFAGGCDTLLKPFLLGRGVDVPMLIILIGAIGGLMFSGIVGLFTGSVVLALGYKLFVEWVARGISQEA